VACEDRNAQGEVLNQGVTAPTVVRIPDQHPRL